MVSYYFSKNFILFSFYAFLGVGPEICSAVQEIVKQTGIPLEFEEVFVSEAYHNRSVSMDVVAASMKKNNGVALKGVIQRQVLDHYNNEPTLNMQLRKKLDLFANVVHIRVRFFKAKNDVIRIQ